jgi:hypothetical protein
MKMKFGKLLAAGKSWAGGNGIGRYQMRDGLHLPKFISPKNPFKQEAVAEPPAPPMVAAAPATEIVEKPAIGFAGEPTPNPFQEGNAFVRALGAPARSAQEKAVLVIRKGMSLLATATPKLKVAAAWSGEALKQAAMFCLDHNPFSAIGKPKLAGIPRFGQPVVQGELSLDRVKVVRNDLSHADLEVVGQK